MAGGREPGWGGGDERQGGGLRGEIALLLAVILAKMDQTLKEISTSTR